MDIRRLTLALALLLLSTGCDRSKAVAERGGDGDVSANLEDRIHRAVKKEAPFGPELRDDGCARLTPKMVSEVLGVPEATLTQRKILGCRYSIEDKSTTAEASLTSIMVHTSVEGAKTWFKNSTANKTREEMQADMAKVQQRVTDAGHLDTQPKQEAAGLLGEALTQTGVSYEDVPGVGDEARIDQQSASLTVRVRNLTFMIQGYKGPAFKPDLAGMNPLKTKDMLQRVAAEEREFVRKTFPERRETAIKLAKLVVAGLD